jgi:type I restriction enzyme, S subunit
MIADLKPYPNMKDSGVPWLGVVPEHWDVLPNRALFLEVKERDHPVPHSDAEKVKLKYGDVLMTEGGDIDKLGRGCVWKDEIPGCLHQNHIFAVRCRKDTLIPEFLVGLMISKHGRAYFQLTAKQTTNLASTNSTTLRVFPVALPSIPEQKAILDKLSEKTMGLESALVKTINEIELIREFRVRLISDVVTGKLDVREAAARLPEETEESEPIDEELLESEADEESGGNELGTHEEIDAD